MAGSRHIRVPNAAAVSRRKDRISRLKGITGSSNASPKPMSNMGRSICPITEGPTTSVAAMAATGMEMASAPMPSTASPARWVSST